MTKMTRSFSVWCLKYHRDIYSLLMFGHIELLTKEMYQEYLDWAQTDEAEDAEFRELPKRGPLYGTKPGTIIIDEFVGIVSD